MTVVLDGGLSTALAEAGFDLSHELWTARLIEENPAALTAAHQAFIEAGAEIVITASYQASVAGFIRKGATPSNAATLLQSTTALARLAVAQAGRSNVAVAASVGPYGAVLADGSEYRGNYAISRDELITFHRDRIGLLDATEPDWWACETIPTAAEAVAIGTALRSMRTRPTWMTFTCRSGSETWGGDAIETAVLAAINSTDLEAVGVNCTAPQFVPELLGRIQRVTNLPLVAYPNSGQTWDVVNKVFLGERGVGTVAALIDAGASFVGGCCGVGPAELAEIARIARSSRLTIKPSSRSGRTAQP